MTLYDAYPTVEEIFFKHKIQILLYYYDMHYHLNFSCRRSVYVPNCSGRELRNC